jgi:hypothetical protein
MMTGMSEFDPERAERLRRLAVTPPPDLPPDPDLDDLPRELAEREGPLVISGVDEDGTHYAAFVTKDDLARGSADARRVREHDEP